MKIIDIEIKENDSREFYSFRNVLHWPNTEFPNRRKFSNHFIDLSDFLKYHFLLKEGINDLNYVNSEESTIEKNRDLFYVSRHIYEKYRTSIDALNEYTGFLRTLNIKNVDLPKEFFYCTEHWKYYYSRSQDIREWLFILNSFRIYEKKIYRHPNWDVQKMELGISIAEDTMPKVLKLSYDRPFILEESGSQLLKKSEFFDISL